MHTEVESDVPGVWVKTPLDHHVDELLATIDRNGRRIDKTLSIGLGLIAGTVIAIGIRRYK